MCGGRIDHCHSGVVGAGLLTEEYHGGDVEEHLGVVAVEAVVEPGHEGAQDEDGDAGVVQFGEQSAHLHRVAVESVVQPGERHTRHSRHEKRQKHLSINIYTNEVSHAEV